MRILLDENISFRIVTIIEPAFPGSVHVTLAGLSAKQDVEIYDYAKANQLLIVTFDEDFYELQLMRGFPPKIIWLRFGNSNNLKIANKLIENQQNILDFNANSEKGILEIF